MAASDSQEERTKQVFLSYASADRGAASRLAELLRGAGLRVWLDVWELAIGDSLAEHVDQAIAASDVLLVLLSSRAVESRWVRHELDAFLARELQDRAVTVIPVLIEDCAVPAALADRMYLDLRDDFEKGAERLIGQLRAVPEVDYSKLDGKTFERLVGDLLIERGFSSERTPPTGDTGFDFIASLPSIDPFGVKRRETWFVEVKLYRDERVSVSALRRMLGYLMTASQGGRGLVVTNGRLTSAAREFLAETVARTGHELRVIDGAELTSILIQHPEIVDRYFRRSAARDE